MLNSGIWQNFCFHSFTMSMYVAQQHDLNSYFTKIAKNGGSIQDGGSKSVLALLWKLAIFFQSVFCIRLVLVRRKFCGNNVFKKIQDGG
jgi:hypothetical protein